MLIQDERDLRDGLRALGGVATPPADLAERSVARARRRRLGQVTFGGALVAGAAAVLLLPFALPTRAPRPVRPAAVMSQSLRTWPDLRDPAWVDAANVALGEYEQGQSHVPPLDTQVRWLYANAVPGTEQVVVAWAYCGPVECPRVVLAHSTKSQALDRDDDPSSSYWPAATGEIGTATATAPLSAYLNGPDGDRGRTTVLFALTPPGTQEVGYATPSGRHGSGGSGTLPAVAGAFAGEIGYVTHPTTLHVRGVLPYDGPVGVPADANETPSVGNAPDVEDVTVPAPYQRGVATGGQLDNPLAVSDGSPNGLKVTVFARCEGSGPLRITYGTREYPVVCDGVQRAAFLDQPVVGKEVLVEINGSDRYATFAVAVAYR